jgi:hypothetical protein
MRAQRESVEDREKKFVNVSTYFLHLLAASGHRLPANTLSQDEKRRRDMVSTIYAAIAEHVPNGSMLLESKALEIGSMVSVVVTSYLQRPLSDDELDALLKKESDAFVSYTNFFVAIA